MSEQLTIARIDLQPLGGIAGDMFASAIFAGFPDLYGNFQSDLRSLGVDGLATTLEDRLSNGLRAKYFNVQQHTALKPPRTLLAVKEFLQNKAIEDSVVKHAVGIFTELAKAEGEVHGKSIDEVHFHEVSDWDSVVDIVAAAGIIARLNCPVWRVGVLPLGSGTVNTAHGHIPVPAPATLALLKGFQWQDDGIGGERVTPTGAAILCYLKASPAGVGAAVANLAAVGSGCGSRELNGRANILQINAFTSASEFPAPNQSAVLNDEVVRIAFEVDDMTAEEIAWAADQLRVANGVLDVSCLSMQGKKNRSSTGFRIIILPEQLQSLVDQSFLLTSTIGIRYCTQARFVLHRVEESMGHVSVKVVSRPTGTISAKTSSDDLASAVSLTVRRQLALAQSEDALRSIAVSAINIEEDQ